MIRVAFVMTRAVQSWNGGVNYLRNLIHAVRSVPDTEIEPVLVVPTWTPEALLTSFSPIEIIRSRLVERVGHAARRLAVRCFGRDVMMERLLHVHDIQVLSHSGTLGPKARYPTIAWLTDFQHRRLPDFCSEEERSHRDTYFRSAVEESTLTVVSSFDAQLDLSNFSPHAAKKGRVLHFVSGAGVTPSGSARFELDRKYGSSRPYFHLPNQFWAHKNHLLVLEALARLRAAGSPALVLATGSTEDYRHPEFFSQLTARAAELGVLTDFRVLGVVPYSDMVALMCNAIAVINPSKFEGWSSTVEESKSFGLRVLLSDIPVHREQAPARGTFFPIDDAGELARCMNIAVSEYSPNLEVALQANATAQLHDRFVEFGRRYSEIVGEAIQVHRHTTPTYA